MNPNLVRGPRGIAFYLSRHCRERWAERFAEPPGELAHAVRFSRVIGTADGGKRWALWYEPHAALFLVIKNGLASFTVATVYSSFVLSSRPGRLSRDLTTLLGYWYQKKVQREYVG